VRETKKQKSQVSIFGVGNRFEFFWGPSQRELVTQNERPLKGGKSSVQYGSKGVIEGNGKTTMIGWWSFSIGFLKGRGKASAGSRRRSDFSVKKKDFRP